MHRIQLGGTVSHVHFIGIGGISMSGLAEILLRDGYTVSGSDAVESDATRHLASLGVVVHTGNVAENITNDIDIAVYTAAVTPDNPEYRAAMAAGIPVIDRARLFGMIMEGYPCTVCVAGTHGKTGTTALIADACLTAGLDPTIQLGGYMGEGYNFRVGHSPYFVMEACEYFDSFLQWKPHIGIILNIDNDHMDFFGNMDRLIGSFIKFAHNIPPDGVLVIYGGTPGFEQIVRGLTCRVVTYGTDGANFTARNLRFDDKGRPSFEIWADGVRITQVDLPLYGEHNAINALAAAAVCQALGMQPETIRQGLESARGAKRRFEYKGVFKGADVADDYAHHPTEIKATLAAARAGRKKGGGRIICVFQPHTYSRTENLLAEFGQSFSDADLLLVLPIFASREAFDGRDEGHLITSRHLADKIRENGCDARYAESFTEAEHFLQDEVMPGDLLITMGAGDVYLLGETLLRTDLSTVSTASFGA